MTTMTDDRIMMNNPNTGREGVRIRVAMYEPVRLAILAAIGEAGELANAALRQQVEARTPTELWEDNSVGWYTTTVKLHLEAETWIAKHGSPQILSLTDAGRVKLASLT